MKKSILVTGGCGYIGSQTIIQILKSTPYDVVSIDNLMNSSEDTLARIEKITSHKITHYTLDLCEITSIKRVFEKHKSELVGVIHFAALKSVPESVNKPIYYYKNNVESMLNVIQCCEEYNIKNFIFSSSCSVYGDVSTLPVNESTPLSPVLSPYAHTKLLGEQMIKFIAEKSKMSFVLLRYFNPVGADPSGLNGELSKDAPNNLVPVICQTAAGIRPKMYVFGDTYDTRDGSCIRDYVHVVDIADAHLRALEFLIQGKNKENYLLFNLGSGEGVSVLEAIKTFEKVTGVSVNYEIVEKREGDVAAIYSDSNKALQDLGWKPKHNIEDMMRTAWAWQKNSTK